MHQATLFGFADELQKVATVLTEKRRAELPKKTFALPQSKEYPIPDRQHAKSALGFAKMHHAGTAEEAKVKAKVQAKYPDMVSG